MDAVQDFFGNVYSSLAVIPFGSLVTMALSAFGGAMFGFAVLCAASRRLRYADKRPVFHFVNMCTALFLAVLLTGVEVRQAVFWSAIFWLAGYLYYGAVCALTRRRAAPPPRAANVVSSLVESRPPRARAADVPAAPGAAVRLDHALSIADKLLVKQLSRTDRQELEKIKTTLTVIQIKGSPTPQENNVVNDMFSALLKLMSKYGY